MTSGFQKQIFAWFLLALFFFAHYFVRISPSLMSIEFMRDFSTSISGIGLISSLYFLTYTFSQLPVGYLIKMYPTRFVVSFASLGCALMALGISYSQNYLQALIFFLAYAFFGSFGFVSATTYASKNIPQYSSFLVGMTQSIGMCAGFLGTNAITQALNHHSWRTIIQVSAIGLAGLSFIVLFFVPSKKDDALSAAQLSSNGTNTQPPKESKNIYRSCQTWTNALYAGFVYFPLMVLTEGGLGPALLTSVHGLSREEIAFAISMIFVAWTIGGPIAGSIADRYGRTTIMRFSALAGLITTSIGIFIPLSYSALCVCLFLFGITNTGIVGCYSIAAEMHGKENASVSIAIANMATILIGSILGGILPRILEIYGHATMKEGAIFYTAHDYQIIFGSAIVICTGLGYILAALTKEINLSKAQ